MYYSSYKVINKKCLNDEEVHILHACCYMVHNKEIIRVTAEKYGYSTTTFWRRIHYDCKVLSPELYECVVVQIQENIKKRGRVKKNEFSKPDYCEN